MALKELQFRITQSARRRLGELAKEQDRAMGRVLSEALETVTAEEIGNTLTRRINNDVVKDPIATKSTLLVTPEGLDRLRAISERCDLPLELTLRLILESYFNKS